MRKGGKANYSCFWGNQPLGGSYAEQGERRKGKEKQEEKKLESGRNISNLNFLFPLTGNSQKRGDSTWGKKNPFVVT